MKFLGLELGNWADWVSGIGAIVAIFLVIKQMKDDKKVYKEEKRREFINSLITKKEAIKELNSTMYLKLTNSISTGNKEFSDMEFFYKYLNKMISYLEWFHLILKNFNDEPLRDDIAKQVIVMIDELSNIKNMNINSSEKLLDLVNKIDKSLQNISSIIMKYP